MYTRASCGVYWRTRRRRTYGWSTAVVRQRASPARHTSMRTYSFVLTARKLAGPSRRMTTLPIFPSSIHWTSWTTATFAVTGVDAAGGGGGAWATWVGAVAEGAAAEV